ncbi:MAG: hypothetical protein LBM02_03555, partial [Lachnospiraceae bacterium]|nr:hypothetical protein [Lachnospiraceae bacterium]
MKIGVVGPEVSCKLIEKYLHDIDDSLLVKMYPRDRINECADDATVFEKECDAILFSGCMVENVVLSKHKIKKPYAYVGRSALSAARAFLSIEREHLKLNALSSDIVEPAVIEDILDAFQLEEKHIYSKPFLPDFEENEYVNWHKKLQDEGKTQAALTSLVWVYKTLKEERYRAFYIGPIRPMVRVAYEKLVRECAVFEATYSQIAVEIFHLEPLKTANEGYYSDMLNKTHIEAEIVQYVKSIQGAIFQFGRDEYVLFSNVGAVKREANIEYLKSLQDNIVSHGYYLQIGIGMGATAYKAETNARKALSYAINKSAGNEALIFKVDENDVLEGPLSSENQLSYQLLSQDYKTLDIAEKTGLSPETIARIISIAETRRSYVFSSMELAEALGISERSGRRILKKITDAGFAKDGGRETAAHGGRPRSYT